jgi:hypothetical protein
MKDRDNKAIGPRQHPSLRVDHTTRPARFLHFLLEALSEKLADNAEQAPKAPSR